MLKDNERLDDLEYKGLRLIQDPAGYCFTGDSVLLANLAKARRGSKVADLGTGSGVIALLMAKKYSPKIIYGIEIQPKLAEMASRNVRYNALEDVITVINKPMQGIHKDIGSDFDAVVANPPYEKSPGENTEEGICKSEIAVTLKEVVECAGKLLKYGGAFFMINKSRRLTDAFCYMRQNNIEPKKLYMVHPKAEKDADTFIVEGKKGGKPGLLVPRPIIVYNDDGTYTEFSRRIYNK